MPLPALAALGVATGAGKLLGGLFQRRQAKKLKQSNYISPELSKAKAEADLLVNSSEYTGQSRDEANLRQNTAQSVANASKVAGGANELLNYNSASQSNQNAGMREISKRALLWRDQMRQNRNAIRSQIASQQAANRAQYQGAKSALIGSSNRNIFGGLTDIAGSYLLGAENPLGFLKKKNKSINGSGEGMDYPF